MVVVVVVGRCSSANCDEEAIFRIALNHFIINVGKRQAILWTTTAFVAATFYGKNYTSKPCMHAYMPPSLQVGFVIHWNEV